MGVGLSIVRGMTEAIGGTATARRADLGGLAIELDLQAAPEPPRRGRGDVVTPTGAHVLLVEDDDATRELRGGQSVRPRLPCGRGDRCAVGDATAGRWAGPDVILLDLGLPDADGLVLIRRVRRDATTPILVLSARDAEPDKVAALETGADDYVTKPFGLPELRARVGALLRRSGGAGRRASRTSDARPGRHRRRPADGHRSREPGRPDAPRIRAAQDA